jgi:transposase
MLTAERQRLDTTSPSVRKRIQTHIAWLEQERADLDRDLHEAVQASALWREQEDLLRSVPSMGPTTAFTLLADVALARTGPAHAQGPCRAGGCRATQL